MARSVGSFQRKIRRVIQRHEGDVSPEAMEEILQTESQRIRKERATLSENN